ncbi:MAG TPA: class I SAM-dependent methyltransferase [Mycobacteriales bacterium]|nr:class I SAM-dependent methyltransferase [Mycobacteriales bacterium]
MDTAAFAARLPGCFPGADLYGEAPLDRRFAKVVETVDGMSTEHTLTLLNLAASLLPAGETYLEVGSYRGRSAVGAALGNPDRTFTAIENFREFGLDPAESERLLRAALSDWDVADRVSLLRGDGFRLLLGGKVPGPVGVYFYDGAHSRLAQHLGLGLAEPVLADEALVVVDDASWPQVERSTERYVARHPGYQLLFDLRAERAEDPRWCNGVKVYAWRRPPGARRARSRPDLVWRRIAHLYLHEPALVAAWRILPRYPRLSAALKRVYLHGGSEVPPPTS